MGVEKFVSLICSSLFEQLTTKDFKIVTFAVLPGKSEAEVFVAGQVKVHVRFGARLERKKAKLSAAQGLGGSPPVNAQLFPPPTMD